MALIKVTVSLLVAAVLTSTWARSTGHRGDARIEENAEQRDNRIELFPNDNKSHEIHESSYSDEEKSYEEALMKKYAKTEAEKFLRKSARIGGKRRRSLHDNEDKAGVPFSSRRLEKMLEKALLKIITGDLNTSDMILLKSLNYSLEEVLSIRERELNKQAHFPLSMDNDLREEQSLTDAPRSNQIENDGEKISKKKVKTTTAMASSSLSEKTTSNGDFDFDAYNRQAIYDYENAANKMSSRASDVDETEPSVDYENRSNENVEISNGDDVVHTNFDRAMEPHVIFKIRYDDSDIDSSSNERAKLLSRERIHRILPKSYRDNGPNNQELHNETAKSIPSTNEFSTSSDLNTTPSNADKKTFQASIDDVLSSLAVTHRLNNFITPFDDLDTAKSPMKPMRPEGRPITMGYNNNLSTARASGSSTSQPETLREKNGTTHETMNNHTSDNWRRKSIYEGLEWVEDDVYRVIPEAMDSLNYYDASANEMENDTTENSRINGTRSLEIERRNDDVENNANDTIDYQNENPQEDIQAQTESDFSTVRNSLNLNLSAYQQLALAHHRDQSQKAIEDIKLKVLAMTGRFNLTSNGNQVQRERLTMFPPICQLPRNTDAEAWSDPFSMNMNFQLNLTSSDHVVAAKVRIYVLPQINMTTSTSGSDEDDAEEKKIRISIYFYTKSLKKHRSKKRLIDSVVIALSSQGSHWALDVRQALRFWRQNLRNTHNLNNNHGLVIQVEDQDGKALRPSQYIHQDSCHTSELDEDEKAYQRVPALFFQACSRYVRVVNGDPVTYVNCSKSSRKGRH
ncbi:uncharacterized protein [Venturia canescens]|uniref:uncharacterized protein isoform X2 n=1 Tax=Venturia canescens TaxID=32260 RepID=UPI001C9CB7AA|nr:uncharacterized protein LOC122414027 isoform X2 [Venturia canescens]